MQNAVKSTMWLPQLHGNKWVRFDAYPREVKELFWYALSGRAGMEGATKADVPFLKRRLAEILARDCLNTYGPDHPQAERGTAEAEAARILQELGL